MAVFSGYVQNLKANREESQEILKDLNTKGWTDRYTRAIFTEFSIYNPNTNLFSVVNLLFEQLPTGALFPYPSILSLRLFRYTGGEMFFVLGCEIVYLLFCVFFIFKEIKCFIRLVGCWCWWFCLYPFSSSFPCSCSCFCFFVFFALALVLVLP